MFPLHDENRPERRPYMNYLLLFVNISIFFFFFMEGGSVLRRGIMVWGVVPGYIVKGERLWTLLTSMFMHADIMHLSGNMLYLWVFGDNIEDALGHIKYLAFYLLGGFAASFTHIISLLVKLPSFGFIGLNVPSVGASGAVSAVLGAYLLLYPRARIRTLVLYIFIRIISVPAILYLGFWFLYQLMMGVFTLTGSSSGVAFWAHIGGFLAGLSSIKFFGAKTRRHRAATGRRPFEHLVVGPRARTPLVDISVEKDRVIILAEMPGVEERDIEIEAGEREVTISAEHGEIRFHVRIPLPTLKVPQVEDLSYRNGVLSLSLSKT